MKLRIIVFFGWFMLVTLQLIAGNSFSVLVEAESFSDKGGWVVDQQFMEQMGSSYLMAHGIGKPVKDAVTGVRFPKAGEYQVFVRTYNWTSPWDEGEGPGKFRVLVNGESTGADLGASGSAWMWQDAGTVTVESKTATVALRDLTGFNGRCDAVFFTMDENLPPNDATTLYAFRKKMLNIPSKP
ncbi:MAG: hypothetical protein PHI28_13820, partial [Mangrovibacterium sp.]|nr:hypothetical protein [Mangrovibacterium sp.]